MQALVVFLFLSTVLTAGMKVYVAHNSTIEKASLQEIKNIYLKKTKFLKRTKVIVYDNKKDYKAFYNKIIQKSDTQIHAYWMKNIFIGDKNPPQKIERINILKTLNSDLSAVVYSNEQLDARIIYEDE